MLMTTTILYLYLLHPLLLKERSSNLHRGFLINMGSFFYISYAFVVIIEGHTANHRWILTSNPNNEILVHDDLRMN